MHIDIRPFRPADQPALRRLVTALIHSMAVLDPLHLFRTESNFDVDAYLAERFRLLESSLGAIFVASSKDDLQGYCMCRVESSSVIDRLNKHPVTVGIIDALYVDASLRGQGVGGRLLAIAEDSLRSKQCAYVSVTALAANEDAVQFYESSGFTPRYVEFMKPL